MVAKRKKAVAGKPLETGTKKKAAGRGTVKLKREANRALDANCDAIARSLVERTIAGDRESLKFMFELAGKSAERTDLGKKWSFSGLAAALATEPKWDGESSEAAVERDDEEKTAKV